LAAGAAAAAAAAAAHTGLWDRPGLDAANTSCLLAEAVGAVKPLLLLLMVLLLAAAPEVAGNVALLHA
jgi:hypothetical protein